MAAVAVHVWVHGALLSRCDMSEHGHRVVSQVHVVRHRLIDFIFAFLRVYLEHANTYKLPPGGRRWENTSVKVASGEWTTNENTYLHVFAKFPGFEEPVFIGKIQVGLQESNACLLFPDGRIYSGNLQEYDEEMKKIR